MKRLKSLLLICFVLAGFLHVIAPPAYAYWDNALRPEQAIHTIGIGSFDSWDLEDLDIIEDAIYIDQEFKNEYMEVDEDGEWVWQKDANGNVENLEEIKQLSVYGSIIVNENIPFLVTTTNYNMVHHGIPSTTNSIGWALYPLTINFIEGWAYSGNSVVKASDGNYYMAKYHTTADPAVSRDTWNKIEPVTDANFNKLSGHDLPDYRNPILNTIQRSYIYDAKTTYIAGDIVLYNGVEWVSQQASTGITPSSSVSWAWKPK